MNEWDTCATCGFAQRAHNGDFKVCQRCHPDVYWTHVANAVRSAPRVAAIALDRQGDTLLLWDGFRHLRLDSEALASGYERRPARNRWLCDENGKLLDENKTLLVENARLRRDVERLEREARRK